MDSIISVSELLEEQTSLCCGTIAGHSTATGPGEIPFLTICCTQTEFSHYSKIFNHSGVRTTP